MSRCWLRGVSIGVWVLAAAVSLPAQEQREVVAGPEYEVSPTARRWSGEGYRSLWTTPFKAPVLDLEREAGGLEPVRQVGGLQTAGLALRGADGRAYTFRSLHKEPERLLPAEWRTSWPARMLRDATSATHPGAAVMLPILADAAGIAHTSPRLVVMPDDPRLGDFRGTFANRLGTFEEFPTARSATYGGFLGATEIITSTDLWERWLASPENRVDTRALLKARMLDLLVDNYDRRRGQWRWMKLPGEALWQPLPEDPDMAFVRHNGLIADIMRRRQPRLLEFGAAFPHSLEGPTSIASEVDRWLLSDAGRDTYDAVVREVTAAWSDEVLARVVAQLPPEWQAAGAFPLVETLRARREALPGYVARFYRFLATEVDVHFTNQGERITIAATADGSTTVSAAVGGGAPFFRRSFRRDETSEVRLYVHGGEDRIERSGPGGGVRVRVIAGDGSKHVESAQAPVEVWARPDQLDGQRVARRDPWVNPQPVAGGPWIEPRNWGGTTIWAPALWFAPDIGVAAGGSVTRTSYGFRSSPAARVQALRGGWAFGQMAGTLEYEGVFRRPAARLSLHLAALASGIEQVNFFGLGNETANVPRSQYRSLQTVFAVSPSIQVGATSRFRATVGPELRYTRTGEDAGTVLARQSPYGFGNLGSVRLKATVEADTRPPDRFGLMAVATGAMSGQPVEQGQGIGLRVVASGYAAPAALDVQSAYGGVDGEVTFYAGGPDTQLALRLGGARTFGDYPFFDAAFLGGASNRGYRLARFAGDASVSGGAEVRWYLTGPVYQSVFPVRMGVVGFADGGRVWLAGERSDKWHPSWGGGALLKPVGTSMVLRAVVARGADGTLFYAGSGFTF